MTTTAQHRVLCVVMDGVGLRHSRFGNAVALARMPTLQRLLATPLSTTLKAHGTYVGLPSDDDIGNSEVGHNALGAGRIFAQGAKLVNIAISDGSVFRGESWMQAVRQVKAGNKTLHFLGLLSDGNVHSHQDHLFAMLRRAKQDGVRRVRVHALLDGRDVGETTAERYVSRLEEVLNELRDQNFDVQVASGGGRMSITMDRYGADWDMVRRGWETHALIAIPAGVVEVVRAEAGKPVLAVLMRQSGRVEQGQRLLPTAGMSAPWLTPQKLAAPDVNTSVRWIDPHELQPTLQSFVMLSAGSAHGVKAGDEFGLYRSGTKELPASESLVATVRVVRSEAGGSSAVIMRQYQADIVVGLSARRVAKVP